jgi:small subunit ribosomal protein S9
MSTDEAAPVPTPAPSPVPAPVPEAAPLPEPPKATKRHPLCTVGRRKKAQARLRIWHGEGAFQVNGRALADYFSMGADRAAATRALDAAGVLKKYDVSVKVTGGGSSGQADATALAVARAVIRLEPAFNRQLRDAGLLSRDARVKERKKYGRRGARRGFQFSKR